MKLGMIIDEGHRNRQTERHLVPPLGLFWGPKNRKSTLKRPEKEGFSLFSIFYAIFG
jgi:hypothetical protein